MRGVAEFLSCCALLIFLMVTAQSAGAVGEGSSIDGSWSPPAGSARVRYETCIAKTFIDPRRAMRDARAWFIAERTDAARHCEAKALIALSQYTDAAVLLSELAYNAQPDNWIIKGSLFAQAGNAWLLADDSEEALRIFDEALQFLPNDPELLMDRARANADLGHFDTAIFDLNSSLDLDPGNPDAYVFRSSARRVLEFHDLALQDVETALQLQPDHPAALLERANLSLIRGDRDAAQRDLLMVIKLAPNTSLARIARETLDPLLYE